MNTKNPAHYIDVEHKNFPKKFEDSSFDFAEGWNACMSVINSLPRQSITVDSKWPEAKWEINPDGYYPYCSNCGEEPQDGRNLQVFCGNCGCHMIDGPQSYMEKLYKHLQKPILKGENNE